MNTEQMMQELAITFPALWTRPLSDFGHAWTGMEGVWTGGQEALMPDGMSIFRGFHCDIEQYDGSVHVAFVEWLRRRGWACDEWDGMTFHLRPLVDLDVAFEWAAAVPAGTNTMITDGCPF